MRKRRAALMFTQLVYDGQNSADETTNRRLGHLCLSCPIGAVSSTSYDRGNLNTLSFDFCTNYGIMELSLVIAAPLSPQSWLRVVFEVVSVEAQYRRAPFLVTHQRSCWALRPGAFFFGFLQHTARGTQAAWDDRRERCQTSRRSCKRDKLAKKRAGVPFHLMGEHRFA